MSSRFNKKRINQGRIELFDGEQEKWLPLAMVPLAERAGLDQMETASPSVESSQPEQPGNQPDLTKLDPSLLLGNAKPATANGPPRMVGLALGLLVGILLVLAVVFFSY